MIPSAQFRRVTCAAPGGFHPTRRNGLQVARSSRSQPPSTLKIGQQPRPDVRYNAGPVGGHLDGRASTSSVHVESAFLLEDQEPLASSESRTRKALSIIYTPTPALHLEEPGLGPPDGGPRSNRSLRNGKPGHDLLLVVTGVAAIVIRADESRDVR
jgi:hypothetical protein